MSAPIINIEHLSKQYSLGARRQGDQGLRHVIERTVRSPFAWLGSRKRSGPPETFWALRDVGLEVERGEVVGIIGRNGAGKSTLLKILSRITEPTSGRVRLRGRVASLLEVGTGFHPELTGRENVFLNGAILGMTRAEIARKFDEIAAFAEVDQFLDTPVKRYSSGMQVRLAFAVAAHLEPEVLVVDEVLAVGDARFQKKCLGRMRHVAAEDGRTVLFVSHNLGALSSLCTRGVVLDEGRVQSDTDIHAALATYVNASMMHVANPGRPATKPRIQSVTLDERALRRGTLDARITFVSPFELEPPIGGITVTDANGVPVLGTNARMHPDGYPGQSARSGVLVCRIPNLPLHSGEYLLDAWLGDMHEDYDAEIGVLSFYFTSADFRPNMPPLAAIGAVNVDATWAFEPILEGAAVRS